MVLSIEYEVPYFELQEPSGLTGDTAMHDQDIEQIRSIIDAMSRRYQARDGAVTFAGIKDGTTVKIAPAGYCWR
jgi:hypothetical protein